MADNFNINNLELDDNTFEVLPDGDYHFTVESHEVGYATSEKMPPNTQQIACYLEIPFMKDGEVKTVVTASGEYQGRTVIIATGSENGRLGLTNEKELTGRGVSYCASCDGAFFRGRTVAVAGGGSSAVRDAIYLADIAARVHLILRQDTPDAEDESLLSGRDNISLITGSRVTKLTADKRLTGIELTAKDGSVSELPVDGLFVSVGRVPENQSFAGLIDLDSAGYAASGEDCLTKTPGIFVAGDNRAKTLRQLVTAASDGAAAATAAVKYMTARK
jgi:thioredoxin reductase (NADPH)